MFKPFPIQQESHELPSSVLPPSGGGPAPEPAPRELRADCEFCGCSLTRRGEVLRLSDKAREYRDQDETIKRLEREKAALASEVAELKAKIQPAAPRASRSVATVG